MKRAARFFYTMIIVTSLSACQQSSPDSSALLKARTTTSEPTSSLESVPEKSNPVPSSSDSYSTPEAASVDPASIPSDEIAPFDPNPVPGEDVASLNANAASYPACGTYYGTVFQCGKLLCAKSDPAYKNICVITSTSKAANGGKTPTASTSGTYPLCTNYYGTVYQCGSNLCAKSDPGYQNPCTIGPQSSPANGGTTPSQTSGSTSYPVCPASGYYGSTFQCGNQTCAKSDPNYQNFCVVTSTSRPVGSTSTSSGSSYPACPATYYGSLFQCGNRTCAKSDPNYQNICVVR